MKHRSGALFDPLADTTHHGSLDTHFDCFWADLFSAFCSVGQHQTHEGPAASHNWFTPFRAQDSSVAYEGQSTAVGRDTFASTSMTMNLTDLGFLSLTTGASELQAIARSDPGEAVYTDTSDMFIPSGADIIFQTTNIVQGSWSDETGEWSASTSTTSFFAIDFYWFDLPNAWTVMAFNVDTRTRPDVQFGNIAYANAAVTANGDRTFTDFSADVLTVEDTISSASLMGSAAASGWLSWLS